MEGHAWTCLHSDVGAQARVLCSEVTRTQGCSEQVAPTSRWWLLSPDLVITISACPHGRGGCAFTAWTGGSGCLAHVCAGDTAETTAPEHTTKLTLGHPSPDAPSQGVGFSCQDPTGAGLAGTERPPRGIAVPTLFSHTPRGSCCWQSCMHWGIFIRVVRVSYQAAVPTGLRECRLHRPGMQFRGGACCAADGQRTGIYVSFAYTPISRVFLGSQPLMD